MSQDILDTMIGAGGVTADPQAAQEHFGQAAALEKAGKTEKWVDIEASAPDLQGALGEVIEYIESL